MKQQYEITIKEKGKRKAVQHSGNGYYLILSDPDNFKGINGFGSTDSAPRILGWMEFMKMVYQANLVLQKQHDAEQVIFREVKKKLLKDIRKNNVKRKK